jgi:hypothetical protein
MAVKLKKQPHCRWCGKAIAKHTESHFIKNWGVSAFTTNQLVTREDCTMLTNLLVLSVKYHYETIDGERTGRRTVMSYNTWDGESYVDEYFCSGEHAKSMGYAAAMKGWSTHKYRATAVDLIAGRFTSDHITEVKK